jgi:WD40 repeat protein
MRALSILTLALGSLLLGCQDGGGGKEQPVAQAKDTQNGDKPLRVIELPQHPMLSAISHDGSMIVTANWGGIPTTLRLWDVGTGKALSPLQFGDDSCSVACLAFSRDGTRVLAGLGSEKSRVSVFDTASGKKLCEFPHYQCTAAFSSDGKQVLTGGQGMMRLWSIETGKEVRSFAHVGNSAVDAVGFSSDGAIAFSRFGHELVRWDAGTGKELSRFSFGSPNNTYSVLFSNDDRAFTTHFKGEQISMWDLATSKPRKVLRVDEPWDIRKLADGYEFQESRNVQISADGKTALSTIATVRVSFRKTQRKDGGTRVVEDFRTVRQKAALWDVEAEKIVRVISKSDSSYAVHLSGDGHTALVGLIGAKGAQFEVWDLRPR